jgi:hypothetical protein
MTGLAFASAPFPHTQSYHCGRVQGLDNLLTLHLARTSELGKFLDYWILDKELNYQTIEYQNNKKNVGCLALLTGQQIKWKKGKSNLFFGSRKNKTKNATRNLRP